MALNLSKTYTPTSGNIANSSSYNTDIANLFNAFSGLEDQTGSLGGLTITPSANGTTKFLVNNSAGTELFSLDTTSGFMKLKATGRFYLDGGGNTYILESSADNIQFQVGGGDSFDVNNVRIYIPTGNRFYLDGGGNTYIQESSADTINVCAGTSEYHFATTAFVPETDGTKNLGTGATNDWGTLFYHTLSQHCDAKDKAEIETAFTDVTKLPTFKSFKRKLKDANGEDHLGNLEYGVLAQECPDEVVSIDLTGTKSVSTSSLIAYISDVVRKLDSRITALEKK